MVSRRSILLGAAAAGAAASAFSEPTTQWQPNVHYTKLEPWPQSQSKNQSIEVVEFFWYGCPHCYTLEPHLVLWERRKPANTELVRIPVAWRAERVAHARLFHALKALHREDLHGEVFDAIHRRRLKLVTPEDQTAFLQPRGIDPKRFLDMHLSTDMDAKLQRSDTLSRGYKITGVPSIAVNGRYLTDVTKAPSESSFISLISHLINLSLTNSAVK